MLQRTFSNDFYTLCRTFLNDFYLLQRTFPNDFSTAKLVQSIDMTKYFGKKKYRASAFFLPKWPVLRGRNSEFLERISIFVLRSVNCARTNKYIHSSICLWLCSNEQAEENGVNRQRSYQHAVTNTQSPTRSHQHEVTNTKSPTRSYQHEVTNTKLPTRSYQHEVTNTKLPTRSHQHEVTNTKSEGMTLFSFYT